MRAPISPYLRGTDRIGLLAGASLALIAVVAALLLSPLPMPGKHLATGIGLVIGGGLLAGSCQYRARHTEGRRRRAWTAFTVAAGLAALSNVLALVNTPTDSPSVGASNVVLLTSLLVTTLGLASFGLTPRRPTNLARLLLDGLIIGGSLMFLASVTIFPHILDAPHARASTLALPVIDIVIATFTTLLVLRSPPAERPMLALIAAGFVGYAVPDFAYALESGRTGIFYSTLR